MTNALVAWRPVLNESAAKRAYWIFGLSLALHAAALAIAAATGNLMQPVAASVATFTPASPIQMRLSQRIAAEPARSVATVPPASPPAAQKRVTQTAVAAQSPPTAATTPTLPSAQIDASSARDDVALATAPIAAPPFDSVAAPPNRASATATPSSAADPAPTAAQPVTLPHTDAAYLDNPRPTYPSIARRLRLEGTVVLRVQVAASGRADRVEIGASSGAELLDRAALEAVQRWRFVPARRGDEAIAHAVDVPIRFRLADA